MAYKHPVQEDVVIERNGHPFSLTSEEVEKAYRSRDKYYKQCDVYDALLTQTKERKIVVSSEEWESLFDKIYRAYDKSFDWTCNNASYLDACCDAALNNLIKERGE